MFTNYTSGHGLTIPNASEPIDSGERVVPLPQHLSRRRQAPDRHGVRAALPGTPLYGAPAGLGDAVSTVRCDVDVLLFAGFDTVMFCNENDRLYQLQAGLESATAMTRVVTEAKPEEILFGVDFLWVARCALAVAVATGASVIREVATEVWEPDMGLLSPDAAHLLQERRRLDAGDLAVFMNITPEFASGLGRRDPAEAAASVTVSSLADVILVSKKMAGAAPGVATVASVREAVDPDVPVLLNTGAKAETVDGYLPYADGCVVGSSLKVDGRIWNPVDPARAKRFVDAARSA